jgi:hypothetical protein
MGIYPTQSDERPRNEDVTLSDSSTLEMSEVIEVPLIRRFAGANHLAQTHFVGKVVTPILIGSPQAAKCSDSLALLYAFGSRRRLAKLPTR